MNKLSQNQVVQIRQTQEYYEVIIKCEDSVFEKLQQLLDINFKNQQEFNIKKNILPMCYKSFLSQLKKNKIEKNENDIMLYKDIKAILSSNQIKEKDFGKVQNLNTLLDLKTPIANKIRENFGFFLDQKRIDMANTKKTNQTGREIYCKLIVEIKKLIQKKDPNRFKKFLSRKV